MHEEQINELYEKALNDFEDKKLQEFIDVIIRHQVANYKYLAYDWEIKHQKLKDKKNEYNEKK